MWKIGSQSPRETCARNTDAHQHKLLLRPPGSSQGQRLQKGRLRSHASCSLSYTVTARLIITVHTQLGWPNQKAYRRRKCFSRLAVDVKGWSSNQTLRCFGRKSDIWTRKLGELGRYVREVAWHDPILKKTNKTQTTIQLQLQAGWNGLGWPQFVLSLDLLTWNDQNSWGIWRPKLSDVPFG